MSQFARMGYPPVLLALGLEPDPRPKVTYTPPRVRLTFVEEATNRLLDEWDQRKRERLEAMVSPPTASPTYVRLSGLTYRQGPHDPLNPSEPPLAEFRGVTFDGTFGWVKSANSWERMKSLGTPCPAPSET